MKKAALLVDYILFIVLFALMFIQSVGTLKTIKYLLLLLAVYFLFKTTMSSKKLNATHVYNFLFMGATIVYVLYGAWYSGSLFANITLYFFVASIIGFALAISYKEPVRKIRPPKRPAVERKTVTKKATKKVVKKTATKKTATKKIAKKITVKDKPKKIAKKKVTKKTIKKVTKKNPAKKSTKKVKPKVAKKVTTTYYKN